MDSHLRLPAGQGPKIWTVLTPRRTGMETIPEEAAEGEATSHGKDAAAASEPSADAAASSLRRGLAAVKLEDGETSGQDCAARGGAQPDSEADVASRAPIAVRSALLEATATAEHNVRGSANGDAAPEEEGAAGGEASAPSQSRRSSRVSVRLNSGDHQSTRRPEHLVEVEGQRWPVTSALVPGPCFC